MHPFKMQKLFEWFAESPGTRSFTIDNKANHSVHILLLQKCWIDGNQKDFILERIVGFQALGLATVDMFGIVVDKMIDDFRHELRKAVGG